LILSIFWKSHCKQEPNSFISMPARPKQKTYLGH